MFLLRITADKDPVEGIVSGLGALAVETVYIILAVLFGISLFKRGRFIRSSNAPGKRTGLTVRQPMLSEQPYTSYLP